MTDTAAVAATRTLDHDAAEIAAPVPHTEVLRDISRGGVAGALVGVIVGGLGGRILMRVAALLHPDAGGALTENGNRVGDITLVGTAALMGFGLAVGLIAGTVWVVVSPWLPRHPGTRVAATAGLAVAIGTPMLIQGRNPDFFILDHDQLLVALLVGLVALVGAAIAITDAWLERRLPHPTSSGARSTWVYLGLTLFGALLVVPITLLMLFDSDELKAPIRPGMALAVVGVCTLAWWLLRLRGSTRPPRWLTATALLGVAATAVLGVLTLLPHVLRAAGVRA